MKERDALVVVGTFTGMDEAAVARGALEHEGIETFLANEHQRCSSACTFASSCTDGVERTRLGTIDDDAEAIHGPPPGPSGAGWTAGGDLVVAERVPRESRRPCRARALLGRRSRVRQ